MRDIDRFIELYKSVGIELRINKYEDRFLSIESMHEDKSGYFYFIQLDQSHHDGHFVGYGGFHSTISFDKDGKFISQGFWE